MNTPADSLSLQDRVTQSYSRLSTALKSAADYLLAHRVDIATRSLRAIAQESRVSPASFSRLARKLGYADYEELRDHARQALQRQNNMFTSKARDLRGATAVPFLPRQVQACVDNISALANETDTQTLAAAADCLSRAQRVVIIGSLGSAGFADYFAYLMSWFKGEWSVAGRNGITLASSLSRLTPQDAVVVITKSPYATRTVQGTRLAAQRGAAVVVITDSHTFPAMDQASYGFVVRSDSPQFFSSYAATLVLIETLAGMLVARAGPDVDSKIQNVIEHNRALGEVVGP